MQIQPMLASVLFMVTFHLSFCISRTSFQTHYWNLWYFKHIFWPTIQINTTWIKSLLQYSNAKNNSHKKFLLKFYATIYLLLNSQTICPCECNVSSFIILKIKLLTFTWITRWSWYITCTFVIILIDIFFIVIYVMLIVIFIVIWYFCCWLWSY